MGQPLPPDSGDNIETDLEAMRRDAQTWQATAARMGEAAAAARQLELDGHDLSCFASQSGLADAYRDVHQWAVGLLEGAHTNLAALAAALTNTAATYRDKDTTGAQRFGELHPGGN